VQPLGPLLRPQRYQHLATGLCGSISGLVLSTCVMVCVGVAGHGNMLQCMRWQLVCEMQEHSNGHAYYAAMQRMQLEQLLKIRPACIQG
jgi:hypothetical protein